MQGIYVITDHTDLSGRSHVDITKAAVDGGASCVQLREKYGCSRELFEIARIMRKITLGTKTLFIVNDRADIALASEADGLHIGQEDLPLAEARKILGPKAIIGVSAGDIEEALEAEAGGADYVGIGPVYTTSTKSDAGDAVGTCAIANAKNALKIPVVAIGGISSESVSEVAIAGADAAAVVSAVTGAPDMTQAVRDLTIEFDAGRRHRDTGG